MTQVSELSERMGRRAARIEMLEWLALQPPTIHTDRARRFIRETENADPDPSRPARGQVEP